jgi:methyltransferase (TIGR00027 family)
MTKKPTIEPESTAVRVALWRALHVQSDPPPHVFEDEIGLELAAPDEGWRSRPDMSAFTQPFRASILARARFIEDLVTDEAAGGVGQYVLLGAGLDTFAQRRPELASRLLVFEVDRPGPQEWKRRRLVELGFGVPPFLRFVPVDFEAGDAWWERLVAAGFDAKRPAVVASTGVSMYLTRDAIAATLRQLSALAPWLDLRDVVHAADRARRSRGASWHRASGQRRALKRHTFYQLLHPDGDARLRPRKRVSKCSARIGGGARRPLLRRPHRRASPARQFGRAADREDVANAGVPSGRA